MECGLNFDCAAQRSGRCFFRALGRHATWYVPAVIGLYNVYDASPEMRMHTLFAEGFGVVGGYAGTSFGTNVVGLGVVAILGLGPFDAFIAIFLCATTFGMAGNALFKWGGGQVHDTGVEVGDRIFHSVDNRGILMTILEKCLAKLFAISLCAWGLIYLITNMQLRKFIVNRYNKETNLSQTAFFRNHVPFVLYLPDFVSAGFFGTHLMMCIWGWRLFGKRKVFRDIDNPNLVIQHFSRKEIRKAKWVLMSGLILFAHGVAFYILRAIWPEMFRQ